MSTPGTPWKFKYTDIVRKKRGSWWVGVVVGAYTTPQTPRGYCVQMALETKNGPVQLYPEEALETITEEEMNEAYKALGRKHT